LWNKFFICVRVDALKQKIRLNAGFFNSQFNAVNYQFSNLTVKARDALTTLMYKVVFDAATAVQPPPVWVIPCAPEVML
jgi:hypothetical protein